MRDYLDAYLDDVRLLSAFAVTAPRFDWAKGLWQHLYSNHDRFSDADRKTLALSFARIAHSLESFPAKRQSPEPPHYHYRYDLPPSERIELLLTWSIYTKDDQYVASAISLLHSSDFNAWDDGLRLIDLALEIRAGVYEDLTRGPEICELIEQAIIDIFRDVYLPSDDLEIMFDRIDDNRDEFSGEVIEAAKHAVMKEIDSAYGAAAGIDSESSLSDHAEILERLGRRVGISATKIAHALSMIEDRIAQVQGSTSRAPSPQITGKSPKDGDMFDNIALQNLFQPLVNE